MNKTSNPLPVVDTITAMNSEPPLGWIGKGIVYSVVGIPAVLLFGLHGIGVFLGALVLLSVLKETVREEIASANAKKI